MGFEQYLWSVRYLGKRFVSYPQRTLVRRRVSRTLGLAKQHQPFRPNAVAALLRIKNEDYWIELVLRTTCKVLETVVVIDSGSTDRTLEILDALRDEGLRFELYRHNERPASLNIVTNLILQHAVAEEYFFLVDGDEIQLEPSLIALVNTVRALVEPHPWKLACQHLFLHPDDIRRCTPPHCPAVRHLSGRVYNRSKLRMSEVTVNDGLEHIDGQPVHGTMQGQYAVLDDVFAIHCPLSQRSTVASWRGHASLNVRHDAYRARYIAPDELYVPLPFFPKEVRDCRWSAHNHYLPTILQSEVRLV